ncbi:MAG: hypothetical protein LIO85_10885 [Rikenellaceae bacterium]|nr:hypothetical protein [Rikenellaceae bacterium]
MAHNCEKCPVRARYDRNPRSLVGRFWRWHIDFCPGWKRYFSSLDEGKRKELTAKYGLKK